MARYVYLVKYTPEASGTIERGMMFELYTAEEADQAISAQLLWTPPGAGCSRSRPVSSDQREIRQSSVCPRGSSLDRPSGVIGWVGRVV